MREIVDAVLLLALIVAPVALAWLGAVLVDRGTEREIQRRRRG